MSISNLLRAPLSIQISLPSSLKIFQGFKLYHPSISLHAHWVASLPLLFTGASTCLLPRQTFSIIFQVLYPVGLPASLNHTVLDTTQCDSCTSSNPFPVSWLENTVFYSLGLCLRILNQNLPF